jgi:hypothetical protein
MPAVVFQSVRDSSATQNGFPVFKHTKATSNGKGKVFEGKEFIADVSYVFRISELPGKLGVVRGTIRNLSPQILYFATQGGIYLEKITGSPGLSRQIAVPGLPSD